MNRKKYIPMIGMGALLVLTEILAIFLSDFFREQNLRAFGEDPGSIANPVYFIGIILVFTLIFLFINKFNLEKFIQIFISLAIFVTLIYSFMALVWKIHQFNLEIIFLISFFLALTITLVYFFNKKWYLINLLGLFIASGAAAIFGFSLKVIPVILLLIVLAIYDAIAVYKTKHMLSLAKDAIKLKIPILFVVPWKQDFSIEEEGLDTGEKEAFFMGVGDAVMPSILVVSSYIYVDPLVSFITAIGSVVGFSFLGYLVIKGKPHAGLPLLNGGSILGFIISYILFFA